MKQTFRGALFIITLNSTTSFILRTGATSVLKEKLLDSYLIHGKVISFDSVGLGLLIFRTLELFPSAYIAFDLSHVISHQ